MATSDGISVIATVRNEIDTIDALLASLVAQTRPADEIVIADGGSTDGTRERLGEWVRAARLPLRVLHAPAANIAAGRNAAIEAAGGAIIASIDAGTRAGREWLAKLVAPIEAGAAAAAGWFAADPRTAFEVALAATTLPLRSEIDPATFLPSSRSVAFTRSAWRAAGGYPEWLDYCEDLVFDFRLIEATGRPTFVPDAVVRYRPRQTLRAFARQYYLYARGDGKAGLWPLRHGVRFGAYVLATLLAVWTWRESALAAVPLAAGGLSMVARPYRRLAALWDALPASERVAAAAWVPVIRVAGDFAKMAGYPTGVVWRLRRRPPEWRPTTSTGVF